MKTGIEFPLFMRRFKLSSDVRNHRTVTETLPKVLGVNDLSLCVACVV